MHALVHGVMAAVTQHGRHSNSLSSQADRTTGVANQAAE